MAFHAILLAFHLLECFKASAQRYFPFHVSFIPSLMCYSGDGFSLRFFPLTGCVYVKTVAFCM